MTYPTRAAHLVLLSNAMRREREEVEQQRAAARRSAPKATPAPKVRPKARPTTATVEPGGMVLSASEARAVRRLLATHPQTTQRF